MSKSKEKFITLKELTAFLKDRCPNLYVSRYGKIFIKRTNIFDLEDYLDLKYSDYHDDEDTRVMIGRFDEFIGTSLFNYGYKRTIFTRYNTNKEKEALLVKIYNILFSEKEKIKKIVTAEANRLYAIASKINLE